MTDPFSLYLHLPFCHKICPYCSFYKHTPGKTDFTAFVDGMLAEARHRQDEIAGRTLQTIYLGGGTPSLLAEKHLSHLFEGLREIFDFSQLVEVDLEANPSTFNLKKAQLFRELGVTRVSLGIQSFQEKELTALGRDHSPTQAAESFNLLREAGIQSCNLDLMFSVPHQTEATWADTLQQALALQPHHISCYNLTYEEDTDYFDRFKKGELSDDPDLNARLFTLAHETLTQSGFRHYETSNYGTPGHHSKHNQGYWKGQSYLGLGPSAVSTLQKKTDQSVATRWKNLPDTANYLRQIETVGHAMTEVENLTEEQFNMERIALLLRTDSGLPRHYLPAEADFDMLLTHNFIRLTDTHVILTEQGALLVDPIAAELAG